MRYLSDKTGKIYNSVEELEKAEKELEVKQKEEDALKAKRAERAKEVEDAFKSASDAEKHAEKVLSDFCKDYGAYHTSLKSGDVFPVFRDPFWDFFMNF